MTCILCRVSLPVSSKRRRLHGVSSAGVLALLQQESSKLGVGTIIPPRSAAQGPYLCIRCFTLAEKVCNARASLQQLESELHGKIHSAASFLPTTQPAAGDSNNYY